MGDLVGKVLGRLLGTVVGDAVGSAALVWVKKLVAVRGSWVGIVVGVRRK